MLGNYKLIEFFEDGELELYDIVNDVSESNNLRDALPEKTAHLAELLHAWQSSVEALMPEKNPDYVPWDRFV